jgi:hypothetical protein
MAEERKRFLKEKILSEMKSLVDSVDTLEELEDCAVALNSIMVDVDNFLILEENNNDK